MGNLLLGICGCGGSVFLVLLAIGLRFVRGARVSPPAKERQEEEQAA